MSAGCSVEGCSRRFWARDLCNTHYARWKRTGAPLGSVARRQFPETFWDKVKTGDGCWEWQGSLNACGYGTIGVRGRTTLAHRASWEIHFGAPGASCICHRCDNPRCVRPEHLFLGSQGDNAADRESKGRGNHALGERNGMALTSSDDARRVRLMLRSRSRHIDIARTTGVSIHVVRDIARGRTWRHLDALP